MDGTFEMRESRRAEPGAYMGLVKGQELSANSFFLALLLPKARQFGTEGICLHSMACWPLRLGGAERSSPNAPRGRAVGARA